MANQTPDDRKQNQQGKESRAGGEDPNRQRTPGGEDNTIERRTDDGGLGRERQAGGRTGQAGERIDDDIERPGSDDESGREAPGSQPRE